MRLLGEAPFKQPTTAQKYLFPWEVRCFLFNFISILFNLFQFWKPNLPEIWDGMRFLAAFLQLHIEHSLKGNVDVSFSIFFSSVFKSSGNFSFSHLQTPDNAVHDEKSTTWNMLEVLEDMVIITQTFGPLFNEPLTPASQTMIPIINLKNQRESGLGSLGVGRSYIALIVEVCFAFYKKKPKLN